jgi:hypothetical protein
LASTIGQCPKCGGSFEEGLIADQHYGDEFERQFWGTKILRRLAGLHTKLENERTVVTFRCTNCNYLESYAK